MSEVLTGIRLVKFYAWEKYFKEKIRLLRSLELKSLKGRKYLDALCVYFWATTPVLMSILTFLMYMYAYKIQLTAAKVFTCVALFNMLISPLNAFPWVINGLVEAWVSVKRVQEFMWLNDLNPDLYYCDELPGMHLLGALSPGEPLIQLFTGHFSWQLPEGTQQTEQSSSQRNALKNINLAIQSGQLVGVCGHVGAGKTSLLAAIMAEMRKTGGYIYVDNLRGGFAYAAQAKTIWKYGDWNPRLFVLNFRKPGFSTLLSVIISYLECLTMTRSIPVSLRHVPFKRIWLFCQLEIRLKLEKMASL
eukprot:m.283915 g.283915  ORF g.283915 m.283915 type:complete len:304 (+) comp40673_c0_seq54:1844-2755(+)